MTLPFSRKTQVQEDIHFWVMKLLQQYPDITQRELAKKLGISLGAINYCLRALMERGLVKMHNFTHSKHKFGYVYMLTPKGISEKSALTGRFLKRKMEEYEALRDEIESLRADL